MKRVSVILTTYNSAQHIERTIHSIRFQEGRGKEFDIELIAVDDHSTDDTQAVLERLGISYYTTERPSGGPNRGRNIGLERASGDFICIADHDDIWHPRKLLMQLPYLEKVPIVSSGYQLVDFSRNKTIQRVAKKDSGFLYYPENRSFLDRLSKRKTGQNCYLGGLIYSSSLRHIRFEEHFGVVDYDWLLRLFHEKDSIEICEALYCRWVDGVNLSLAASYRAKDFYYTMLSMEEYEARYPKAVARAMRRLQGSRARYYYLTGDMSRARKHFAMSDYNAKTLAYLLTSYFGSGWVRRVFSVFG